MTLVCVEGTWQELLLEIRVLPEKGPFLKQAVSKLRVGRAVPGLTVAAEQNANTAPAFPPTSPGYSVQN